ncbi:MAG TPA: choice-of-anchor tandem repeat GloVer-containing protein [Rhizomicrobium sp.]|nr:choice-of-anchor tandem repeat GloVer-containing protein [Rhizomicrobium sp.]
MKERCSSKYLLSTALVACALGCAVYSPAAEAATEKVLYSFGNAPDGQNPEGGLIDVGGTLYGATENGGTGCSGSGCGTVFSVNPQTGAEAVLYSFCGQANCTDGKYPRFGSLINIKGMLYGTTQQGGSNPAGCSGYGCGTVFALNPATDQETVLHSFGNGTDGWWPLAGLLKVKDTLYGTTWRGGPQSNCSGSGCGTVFSLDRKTDAEAVVYSFEGYSAGDGANPRDSLINVDGTLYGTTFFGGPAKNGEGYGTVFSVNPKTRAETVLYSFDGGDTDGGSPVAGLIQDKGMLYGVTQSDGAYYNGTVFSINPQTGAETVLYSFGNGTDAQTPIGGLVRVGHELYGTSYSGGIYNDGAVFSYDTTTGAEKVLWSFGSGTDGENPYAGLINVGGTLYGTTASGGSYGNGTVFSIVP